MPRCYLGADLSKEWVDLYHPKDETHHKIANKPRAIRAFLWTMQEDDILIFEATSGCDDTLLAQIRAEGMAFGKGDIPLFCPLTHLLLFL